MAIPYRTVSLASQSLEPSLAFIKNAISIFDNLEFIPDVSNEQRSRLVRVPAKSTKTMSLLVCKMGNAVVKVGSDEYELTDRDCLFVRSGIIAELRSMDDRCTFFTILLNEDYYFPVFGSAALTLLQRNWIKNPVCKLEEAELEESIALYKRIKERMLSTTGEMFQADILKGYVQSLLYIIYSGYLTEGEGTSQERVSRKRELYNRFVGLVEKNYTKERGIAFYAGELCITPRYLSKVVYEESGCKAGDYIDDFVISEAKRLLKSRQYTVLQICDLLGFPNQSFFSRYFKRLTGFTPTEYQKLDQ